MWWVEAREPPAVAVSAVVAVLAMPLFLIGGIGALVLVDPVLIAVTEDGYWVEIDRWYS